MNWFWFWLIVAVVVAALIFISRADGARTWAGRVFGRVLPGLPSLAGASGLLGSLKANAWKLLAIPLAIGVIYGVVSYIEGKGALREQIKEERVTTAVARHETNVGRIGQENAEATHRDARRRERVIAQVEREIEDAVSEADFDRLRDAYERGHGLVWGDIEAEGESDHAPRGSDPVRGARGYTA